ncbi:MAG: dihydrofolate reductase [Lachnospiraceae bacterium]|nr:dihydrofolate reductase [Lachnospiraceae bacterium]
MILIAAVDRNWAIGSKGQLLVSIPHDQKAFREKTLGQVIVMGRKTFESLPGKQPLYGRTNIVLSTDPAYQVKGAIVCHSLEETLEVLKDYRSDAVYVIGGESVYRKFLPYCDRAEITYIDFAYSADTHFPNLEELEGWEMTAESEEQTYFDLCYTYREYRKK